MAAEDHSPLLPREMPRPGSFPRDRQGVPLPWLPGIQGHQVLGACLLLIPLRSLCVSGFLLFLHKVSYILTQDF